MKESYSSLEQVSGPEKGTAVPVMFFEMERMLHMKHATVLFCILSAMLLTSCGKPQEAPLTESSSPSVMMQENADSAEREEIELQMVTGAYGMDMQIASQQGFYRYSASISDASESGSGNILYTDFASATEIALCSRPDCRHSDESCTSWFPFRGGKLFLNADRTVLFLVGSAGSPESGDQLWRMNPDGSGRTLLYECKSGERFSDAVASDGKDIYITLSTANVGNPETRRKLLRIDPETGESTDLFSFSVLKALMSAFGDQLVFWGKNDDDTMMEYSLYSLFSGEWSKVYSYPTEGKAPEQGVGAYPDGAYLYIFAQSGEWLAEVRKLDMRTGSVQTLCTDLPYFGPDSISVNGLLDGKIEVTLADTRANDPALVERYCYWIDCETGELTKNTLEYPFGTVTQSVAVLAEYEDSFFVQRGVEYIPVMLTGMDGTAYESTVETPVYAMISRADYFANHPAYQDIVSAVLPGA